MACPDCENIENYDCGCQEAEYCNCKIKLSTVCILYEGVKLTVLDTYEGENLEEILIRIEKLFREIFDKLESQTYKNIGDGAKVFKKVNALQQAEFRTILSSESINAIENLNDIGISINETWLYNFIVDADVETTTNITETIIGKKIAKYTNEDGIAQNINETITTLLNNGDGSFTYTNEQGVASTFDAASYETSTTFSNLITGHRIATFTNEVGNNFDINEKVTTLVNNGNNGLTYTNENGVVSSYNPLDATTSNKGIAELATDVETQTGTDPTRVVTPFGLSSRTANDTRTGLARIATQVEANALASTTTIITPARIPKATTTQQGIVRFATQGEVDAGTATNLIVSPSTLQQTINNLGSGPGSGFGVILAKGKIVLGDSVGSATVGQSKPVTGDYTSCIVASSSGPDLLITLNFPNVGTVDYHPLITIISKGVNYNNDNDIITICRNLNATSVQIALREISGNVQNIDLLVSLLKL